MSKINKKKTAKIVAEMLDTVEWDKVTGKSDRDFREGLSEEDKLIFDTLNKIGNDDTPDFLRMKMREDGFARKLFPMQNATATEVDDG